jgi:hypothetical protein
LRVFRARGAAVVGRVGAFESLLELAPVDGVGEPDEFVLVVDQVGEHDFPEQGLDRLAGGAFGHHFSGVSGGFAWFCWRNPIKTAPGNAKKKNIYFIVKQLVETN